MRKEDIEVARKTKILQGTPIPLRDILEQLVRLLSDANRERDKAKKAGMIYELVRRLKVQGYLDFKDATRIIADVISVSWDGVVLNEKGFAMGTAVTWYGRAARITNINDKFRAQITFEDGAKPRVMGNVSPSLLFPISK